jgi:hypothetical protein
MREEGPGNHADLHEEDSIGMKDGLDSSQTDDRIIRPDSCDVSFLFFRGSGEGECPISSPSARSVTVIGEASPSVSHLEGYSGQRGPVSATGPRGGRASGRQADE